ncbi:MAG: TetR/AcrR family transcriptional regulator [Gammaproteobacteria bacterium]|nr:TetR/AcrR family transcriptional regulator [Gammaproteobacteria bacterium]
MPDQTVDRHLFDKDKRREARVEAILNAVGAVISRRGASRLSLDDVARSLGVTKPTLYHYVGGKAQLLGLCLMRVLDVKERLLAEAERCGANGRDKLERFYRDYAAYAWSDASGMPALILTPDIDVETRLAFNRRNLALVERTRAIIDEGTRDGSLRVERAELVENFLIGTILWGSVSFLQRAQPIDADVVVDHYLSYLFDGIAAPDAEPSN